MREGLMIGFYSDNFHNDFLYTQAMALAILFESIISILDAVMHNWQCISWLYIDSTKNGTSMLKGTNMFRNRIGALISVTHS